MLFSSTLSLLILSTSVLSAPLADAGHSPTTSSLEKRGSSHHRCRRNPHACRKHHHGQTHRVHHHAAHVAAHPELQSKTPPSNAVVAEPVLTQKPPVLLHHPHHTSTQGAPVSPPKTVAPSTQSQAPVAPTQQGYQKPFGFAAAATGGGSAPCEVAADIHQLAEWLGDKTPRCILLNGIYDFTGSQGKETTAGCRPSFDNCGDAGQLAVVEPGSTWCSDQNFPHVDVVVDKAGLAINAMKVKSNKTLRGLGAGAEIIGRGLMIFGETNVIIQNIWIHDINPEFVFGGDAIALKDTDLVFISHCKFSMIGRQMIVTGKEPVRRVTIAYSEFDGFNKHSATCNTEHYWTLLFYGLEASLSLANNYIHHISGRGPQVGGVTSDGATVILHATSNLWKNVEGIAFNVGEGAHVLAEGNHFENVKTPILNDPQHPAYFVINNNLVTGVSGQLSGSPFTPALRAQWNDNVPLEYVDPTIHAGIGKL